MNYTSFIVKVIEKPIQTFINNTTLVTEITVQLPLLRNESENTILSLSVWGKLGYDVVKYYRMNDYIIIEGYLSIRESFHNQLIIERFKKVEISVYKVYPFILSFENHIAEY